MNTREIEQGRDRPVPVNRPGARGTMVSLRDVAKEAKVSVATVSMVLNGNPRISVATSTRIQQLVKRMGYQPNRLAQSLSGRYTHVVAVMLPALRHVLAHPYFGELISGICDKAGKMGYKVMLEQAKPEFLREKEHIRIFERRYVDGVLCLGTDDQHAWLEDFGQAGCPAMVVDNDFDSLTIDHVVCDYRSGAEQATDHLAQLGHRSVGLIAASSQKKTARTVRDVYRSRMLGVGMALPDTWVSEGKQTEEGGAEAARDLLGHHPDITALFAGNDEMAIGAMHQLAIFGVRVPQDVSVIGFDDLQHTAFINPTLTTIHLPLYEVGAMAMERLIERIRGRSEPVDEMLPTHLVARDSTAPARSVN